jgi:predicted MFS family arabinose efflux permease
MDSATDIARSSSGRPRAKVPVSIIVSTAAVAFSFGAIFGLVPDLQRELGFSDSGLGIVTAAAFLAGFSAQVGLARFADRGHGRLLLLAGVGLAMVGCIGVALAPSFGLLVAARFVLGFGDGMFLPAARRVAIVRNPHAVGAALGRFGSAQTAGFLLGPPFAAYLADATDLWVPFVVVGAVLAAMLPLLARFDVPENADAHHERALRALVTNRGVRIGILIATGFMLAIGAYDSLWARFLKDLGASTKFVALSLTIFSAPIIVLGPIAGRLADRFGPVRVGCICLVCSTPFIFSYSVLHNYWVIAALALGHSAFDGSINPASQSQVARSVTANLVAAGQGLLDGMGLLTAALSSVVSAYVYERFGPSTLWTGLAIAVLGCAGLAWAGRSAEARSPAASD